MSLPVVYIAFTGKQLYVQVQGRLGVAWLGRLVDEHIFRLPFDAVNEGFLRENDNYGYQSIQLPLMQ